MSKRGIRVWELIVAVLLIGGGLVLFVQAAERVRWRGHALIPTTHMRDIISACDRYHEQHRKWPTVATDLQPYMTRPDTYESLAEGWYVVVWEALPKKAEEGSETILVYQKQAVTVGGFVCYRDGRVERITAEEAKAALVTGKK